MVIVKIGEEKITLNNVSPDATDQEIQDVLRRTHPEVVGGAMKRTVKDGVGYVELTKKPGRKG